MKIFPFYLCEYIRSTALSFENHVLVDATSLRLLAALDNEASDRVYKLNKNIAVCGVHHRLECVCACSSSIEKRVGMRRTEQSTMLIAILMKINPIYVPVDSSMQVSFSVLSFQWNVLMGHYQMTITLYIELLIIVLSHKTKEEKCEKYFILQEFFCRPYTNAIILKTASYDYQLVYDRTAFVTLQIFYYDLI